MTIFRFDTGVSVVSGVTGVICHIDQRRLSDAANDRIALMTGASYHLLHHTYRRGIAVIDRPSAVCERARPAPRPLVSVPGALLLHVERLHLFSRIALAMSSKVGCGQSLVDFIRSSPSP